MRFRALFAYFWSAGGVVLATSLLWLAREHLDKGQASLLYLPVVIACAVLLGFGPAVTAAVLSFGCWDFFFLPPLYRLTVDDPRDWLSLVVFLVAAVTTAGLASRMREQTSQAQAREGEIAVLFQASETLNREVGAVGMIETLSSQLRTLCQASECIVWRISKDASHAHRLIELAGGNPTAPRGGQALDLAEAVAEHGQTIGFDDASRALWARAIGGNVRATGAYIPLHAENRAVGVLHVGARIDSKPFSPMDRRLILTLANHVAVVIARETLAAQAAQAEALRESDHLKDSLLSMVSHELRSPLAAIKATVTDLMSRPGVVGDAAYEELAVIDSEADRLNALVGNLLDLSRLEAGAWTPAKDWCDVGEIIATALDRLPPADADRVSVDIADGVPMIRADYTQIALVITNLLQNAVKYTPSAAPIAISLKQVHSGVEELAHGILLQVRDFGLGVASGDEEAIFGRFYRSTVHEKGAVRGTGLGLAICRAIVVAHGGRIWASNAPQGEHSGAIFSVLLPVE